MVGRFDVLRCAPLTGRDPVRGAGKRRTCGIDRPERAAAWLIWASRPDTSRQFRWPGAGWTRWPAGAANRGAGAPRASSAIDLHDVDLFDGYDYRSMINATPDGANAYDPRYGMPDLFEPGTQGQVSVKFLF